jgi:DNA invertase Pin-like site-specific DNA recombinase
MDAVGRIVWPGREAPVAPKKKEIRRAIVYTRVSFTANRTRGNGRESSVETSPERQEERCRAYCAAQDWEVTEIYTDRGVSAFTGADRPGWSQVVQAVEAGETDAVVVFALDRAGRNTIKLLQFAQTCKDHDVSFVSVTQDINTGGTYGKVILAVFAAVAEIESAMKKERALSKHIEMAEQGRYAGSWRPFGYTRDMEQVPVEADAIRRGAELFLNGSTLQAVARQWNAARLRTTAVTKARPDGGAWTTTSVRRVFENPVYIGLRVHVGRDENGKKPRDRSGGTEYRGAWEPVLAKPTFKRLVGRLKDNSENHIPRRSEKYLLTGLLVCGVKGCGRRLVGHPSNGIRRYVCLKSGKNHLGIDATALDVYVGQEASIARLTKGSIRVADPATLSAPLLAKLNEAEEKLAAFARNAALAGFSADEMREGRAPLAAERDRLTAELEALADAPAPASILITADSTGALKAGHYTPEWAAMIAVRVDHVVVEPTGHRRVPVEDRVRIVWRDGVKVPEPDDGSRITTPPSSTEVVRRREDAPGREVRANFSPSSKPR